jgi:ankyrin repeat protein
MFTLQMREGEALLERRAESIVKGLEQRAASLRGRVKRLATIVTDPNRTTAGPVPAVPADEEEKEIRRIQALVKDSPDLINATEQGGQRPLHLAASRGQLRVAEYLIANGADLNAASLYNGAPTGPTPLRAAAAAGHKKMVELLLSKGANTQGNGNSTALHDAAGKGYKSIVEVLLASNADVNAQDRLGATPLVYAVKNNHLAVARLLLANKAKTEFTAASYQASPTGGLRDFSGQYPLHIAVRARHEEMIELLLQNGAGPNVKVNGATGDDSPGATPLLLAVDYQTEVRDAGFAEGQGGSGHRRRGCAHSTSRSR